MQNIKKFIAFFLCVSFLGLSFPARTVSADTGDTYPFIILSHYSAKADIGEEFYLIAFTSTGKKASWKSSDSKVASVNTYGKVTAKKGGSALITAKITNAEASCRVTVNKTKITLSAVAISMERGESLRLTATTSNNSSVTWKSSKKTIAVIDEYGTVTGIKPGQTTITAKADGSESTCTVTVKAPSILLNRSSLQLYRGGAAKLSATVSSKINPAWKSNKKSVATVDSNGIVTAVKNGTAVITATVDGVSKTCLVTVLKPDITLSSYELSIKKGEKAILKAEVSSGNRPAWSSSNPQKATVNSYGEITAIEKGTAYVYASEDGTKKRCKIYITD